MIILKSTIINAITIIIGSSIGLLLNRKIPDNIKTIVFQAIGLSTILLGINMGLKSTNFIYIIFSVIIGVIIGEFFKLDHKFQIFSENIKHKFKFKDEYFTEGLISAFLIFCIGSMTIVGAINAGINNDHTLLLTKSILDGFTSIALASTFGIGVMLSFIPLLIFQGGITIFANFFAKFFSSEIINDLTAVGGIIILALALEILNLKKMKLINFLPALVIIIIFHIII